MCECFKKLAENYRWFEISKNGRYVGKGYPHTYINKKFKRIEFCPICSKYVKNKLLKWKRNDLKQDQNINIGFISQDNLRVSHEAFYEKDQVEKINKELKSYSKTLAKKPQLLLINKIDSSISEIISSASLESFQAPYISVIFSSFFKEVINNL